MVVFIMKYSKSQIDKAGKILSSKDSSVEQVNDSLMILGDFRALHRYPLRVFGQRLERVSEKIDSGALTAQRLKRLVSIVRKLKRGYDGNEAKMKLSRMQDVVGCRAVMLNMNKVMELYSEGFVNSNIKHERVNVKDYVTYPKKDGYRSIHLVYKFKSDKGKKDYNGFLVEIQIRSRLQHLWATAVEIVDFFTQQSIKLDKGKKEWVDFFRLVSSAFARMEKTALVPNTPLDEKELYRLIKEKEAQLGVIKMMRQWKKAIRYFRSKTKERSDVAYFLLELDLSTESLRVSGYSKNKEDKAIEDYGRLEKNNRGNKEYDVVLVGADSLEELEKAYPNYFVDADDFLEKLSEIIGEVGGRG